MKDTLAQLQKQTVLRACGFLDFQSPVEKSASYKDVLACDQEFAEIAGPMALHLVARRSRRLFHAAEGVRPRVWRGLVSEKLGMAAAGTFWLDVKADNWVKELPDHGPVASTILSRTPFNTTGVRHIWKGYEESKFRRTKDMNALSGRFVFGMNSSNIIELVNNLEVNNKQARGTTRFRRPPRVYVSAMASNIIGGRYKLVQPEPSVQVNRKSRQLEKTAYGRHAPKCSLDLTGVCTLRQKAEYWSPKVENLGMSYADVHVVGEAFPCTLR